MGTFWKGVWSRLRVHRVLVVLLLLPVVIFLICRPSVDLGKALGRQHLLERNEKYLSDAVEESYATFLLLSGLKAGLKVMERKSARIALIEEEDLQIGELILDSAHEVVSYGWFASIFSLTVLGAMRILLDALEWVSPFLLLACLCSILFHHSLLLLLHRVGDRLRALTYGVLVLSMLGYIGLPLAILGASATSKAITSTHSAQVRSQIESEHKDLLVQQYGESMKLLAEAAMSSYVKSSDQVNKKHRHLTEQVVRHLGVVLFDVIVIPVLFLVGMLYLCRSLGRRFLTVFWKTSDKGKQGKDGQGEQGTELGTVALGS